MASVQVNIRPEIIHWALRQTQKEKLGDKLMDNIAKWLNGTKTPTFRQIEDFSKKANIPLGYFFLQTPPVEQIDLLEFRTINSVQMTNPSRNFIDTVHEMQTVQDWMISYRQDFGFEKLSVVGCMKNVQDIDNIARRIRSDLNLSSTWSKQSSDSCVAFKHIRSQLELCGVVVMVNGIVGQNSHRSLNTDEFRAFAMVNQWAPLIFINAADSAGARLFSLLHETVHIWLGENDLFNDKKYRLSGVSDTEVLCNAVTAELLIPRNIFLENWAMSDDDPYTKIREIAKEFRCGEVVVARRAYDARKIEKNTYNQIVQNAIENYNEQKQQKSAGGNYYYTKGARLDSCFVKALCESIRAGRTTYTEAYRLTNTSRKTFSEVVHCLGGIPLLRQKCHQVD